MTKLLHFGTRKVPRAADHKWLDVKGVTTFQGFTLFGDRAAHRVMEREVAFELHCSAPTLNP